MLVDFRAVDWLEFFKGYGLVPRAKRQKRNKGAEIVNVFAAFDIETSTVWLSDEHTDAHSFMYIWQFQIEDYTIIGREWSEWLIFCERATKQLKQDEYIMIYVHNLSYEFSFLKGIYSFDQEEVFAIEPRKVLKCEMFNCMELRCSYLPRYYLRHCASEIWQRRFRSI